MQEAEARQILERMGGAPTPANLQKILEQAPNESALLGKSLGLHGGEGEGQDTNVFLDKLLSKTDRPALAAAPVPEVSSGMNYPAGPAVARAPVVQAPDVPPIGVVGPTSKAPNDANATGPLDMPAEQSAGNPGLLSALASLLGITSVAGRMRMGIPGNDAFPRTIPNAVPAAKTIGGNVGAATGQTVSNIGTAPLAAGTAADRIEGRRPINTNTDARNSEPVNKPVNLGSTPAVPDDSIPTNLIEQVSKNARRFKGMR